MRARSVPTLRKNKFIWLCTSFTEWEIRARRAKLGPTSLWYIVVTRLLKPTTCEPSVSVGQCWGRRHNVKISYCNVDISEWKHEKKTSIQNRSGAHFTGTSCSVISSVCRQQHLKFICKSCKTKYRSAQWSLICDTWSNAPMVIPMSDFDIPNASLLYHSWLLAAGCKRK